MQTLPMELIWMIGSYLENNDILNCLTVNKFWRLVLEPLLWQTIERRHWTHRSFPLKIDSSQHQDFSLFKHRLKDIISLEWSDYDSDFNTSFIINHFESFIDYQTQRITKILNITNMINQCTRLTSLHLCVPHLIINHNFKSTISSLTSLKDLSLHFLRSSSSEILQQDSIELLFPAMKGLRSLTIIGNGNNDWRRQQTCEIVPDQDLLDVKNVHIRPQDIWILNHFRNIDHLSITTSNIIIRPISLSCITKFTNLTRLKIDHSNQAGFLTNLPESICLLKNLLSLGVYICDLKLLKNLTTSSKELNQVNSNPSLEEEFPLPLLQDFEIIGVAIWITIHQFKTFSNRMSRFLRSRHRLKSLIVKGCPLHIVTLFSATATVTTTDQKQNGTYWACKNLELLQMEISTSLGFNHSPIKQQDHLWENAFNQIGQLTKLKSISITSNILLIQNDTTIMRLATMHNNHYEPKLLYVEDVSFLIREKAFWDKEEVTLLISLFPLLKTLTLYKSNINDIQKWIGETGRHIEIIIE